MALAIDASTPALASGSTAAITSASFTTPASVLLVAFVGRDSASSGIDSTGTVSGAGLTWALAGRKSSVGATGQVAGGTAQPGCAEIWWAYSDTALTSVTVTDTRTSGADDHAMQVVVITGAESTWGGGIAANGAASGLPTATLTTTAANSWVMACSTDWSARGNATAGSGQTIISQFHLASQISIHFWRQTTTTATSGTSVTNNLTAPTGQQYDMLAIEVREAAGASESHSGSLALTGSGALSLAGTVALAGTLALTGGGGLGFGATPATAGTLARTGSGTLTLAGAPATSGTLARTGSGSLTLGGTPAASGALPLSGSGQLDLSGSSSETTAGTLARTGSGALTLGGAPAASGGLPLTGSGSLAFGGSPSYTGTLDLTGSGGITFGGTLSARGALALTGSGTLTASGIGTEGAGGALARTGSGTLTFAGAPGVTGVLVLTGGGQLATSPTSLATGGALPLSGSGVLTLYVPPDTPAPTPPSRTVYTAHRVDTVYTGPRESTVYTTPADRIVYA